MRSEARALEALLAALGEARAGLLATIEGITQDELARPLEGRDIGGRNVRELLWMAGAFDDWTRLVIDQGLDGRPVGAWAPRARPAYLNTPELLVAWLEQTRGALLARARKVTAAELDRELVLADGERASPRELLGAVIERDSELAGFLRLVRRSSTA